MYKLEIDVDVCVIFVDDDVLVSSRQGFCLLLTGR